MGLILCLLGFLGVAVVIRRSLGDGLGLLLAIGSIYGIARANVYDGYTHFLFDASVLGAYTGGWHRLTAARSVGQRRLRAWVIALSLLAFLAILISPFLDAQPILVQLLGLRPAIFFVPLALLGGCVERDDIARLARWTVVIVFVVSGVATAEYILGVERFFPMNEASNIIYLSQDVAVGESREFRIPGTFNSAHAYGGAMVSFIPLLVSLLEQRGRWRLPAAIALVCAAIGVFASGARSPVIALVAVTAALGVRGLHNRGLRLGLVAASCAILAVVPRVSRFQRFETLSDMGYATARVQASINVGFLDTIVNYPIGRGLGSAIGTSIPFFLADQARAQIGMENEYVRIAVEEGVLGLGLWVAFMFYVLAQNPLRLDRFGPVVGLGMWMVCLFNWIQGLVGTGMLASVPGTAILMIFMGSIAVQRPGLERREALSQRMVDRLATQ
jgi:hypothetical protein